ncbi:bacteriocin immunity protein [Enterobacterales bacterium AW_CKDN230030176-1A_HGKHYDSX7]
MDNKKTLQDYTESEFRAFLNLIFETNASEPDEILDPLLEHFTAIIEHPAGTDLIYWPEAKGLDEPDEIIRIIKEWRLANNKPLFKSH